MDGWDEGKNKENRKKFGPFLDLCVSSLRRGHANLLCIVPILSDVSEETITDYTLMQYKGRIHFVRIRCGMGRLRTASFLLWSPSPLLIWREREYGNDNFVLIELS